MINYKVTVQYDGTRYSGWQRQKQNDGTIQGKIEQLLSKLEGTCVTINGSGRTDAGVHAKGQVFNVFLATTKTPEAIKEYMNEYLPADIYVTEVENVYARFHARLSATGKQYRYRIVNHEHPSLFERYYTHHIPQVLDVIKMEAASKSLIGTHDFASFTSKKNKKKSTIRTIESIILIKEGAMVEVVFKGNGFLYHMIRIIMGTLIEVGLGERDVAEVEHILEQKDRAQAGHLAPAKGLCLEQVTYREEK